LRASRLKVRLVALVLAVAATALLTGVGARSMRAAPQQAWGWWPAPSADARYGHAAVLDAQLHRMIVLGGVGPGGEVRGPRQLDLIDDTWAPYAPGGDAPVRRPGSAPVSTSGAVIDGSERVVLTECDCQGGSTFLLDLAAGTWSHAPGDIDLAIVGGALAYDSVADAAILYGGRRRAIGDPVAGVWLYDLSDARAGWRSVADAPQARLRASAIVDPASRHMLVFGGQDAALEPVGTLWRVDLAHAEEPGSWTDITALAGPGPSPRVGASFVWVPEQGAGLLYGGYGLGGDSDEVWWLEYADPSAPRWVRAELGNDGAGARSAHAAVWDAGAGHLVVYAGTRGLGLGVEVRDDAWSLRPGIPPTATADASASPTVTPWPGARIHLPVARRGF
jgi:hypothetical protein